MLKRLLGIPDDPFEKARQKHEQEQAVEKKKQEREEAIMLEQLTTLSARYYPIFAQLQRNLKKMKWNTNSLKLKALPILANGMISGENGLQAIKVPQILFQFEKQEFKGVNLSPYLINAVTFTLHINFEDPSKIGVSWRFSEDEYDGQIFICSVDSFESILAELLVEKHFWGG